jgi:hypothetical protein
MLNESVLPRAGLGANEWLRRQQFGGVNRFVGNANYHSSNDSMKTSAEAAITRLSDSDYVADIHVGKILNERGQNKI